MEKEKRGKEKTGKHTAPKMHFNVFYLKCFAFSLVYLIQFLSFLNFTYFNV
jgi:hypothetical protein